MTDAPPEEPAQTPGGIPFRFFNEIGIISQLSSRVFERSLQPDLTLAQFILLNHLVRVSPESSPQRIARALQLAKSAITKTVGHLQAKGFVETAPDPNDGRGKIVRLTDAGRAARNRGIETLTPHLAALADAVSTDTLAEALPALTAVRQFLDAARD